MSAHNESSVSMTPVWTNDNYSAVRYGLIESVKESFNKTGEVTFSQPTSI